MKNIILFKKFLSFFLIISLLSNFIVSTSNAVSTNWQAVPWTLEKAEHLAKRALIWPNPQIIQDLFNAWSAWNAVNLLFPSKEWVDKTQYLAELEAFKWPTFNPSDTNQNRKVLYKIIDYQINNVTGAYQYLIPLGLAIGLFITLKIISLLYVAIVIMLSWLVLKLLIALKFAKFEKIQKEVETVKLWVRIIIRY